MSREPVGLSPAATSDSSMADGDLPDARPLTARSVLASALLGEDPPELPVAHLIHLAGLFGINANRTRVALSRMVASGEAVSNGSGRYRLAGPLLERRDRQEGSRRGWTGPWDGRWRLVVVVGAASTPEHRADRRRRLIQARYGEQREGVWLRPDNLDGHAPPGDDPDLTVFTGVPADDPIAMAATLWDLAGWADRASQLAGQLERNPTEAPDDLASGFTLSAAVLRHLQSDPLLPPELLPPGWPGPALRGIYQSWDQEYRDVLRTWGRSTRTT